MDREAWRTVDHGVAESDMTEQLNWTDIIELICLKDHRTALHPYAWHTPRDMPTAYRAMQLLLLQAFYCEYWSANSFVCMRGSIWRINCWVGLSGQRVNSIKFLQFILLSCSAKSWVKWQLRQFGLPGQHTDSQTLMFINWLGEKWDLLILLNLHSFLLLWMRLSIFSCGWTEAPL